MPIPSTLPHASSRLLLILFYSFLDCLQCVYIFLKVCCPKQYSLALSSVKESGRITLFTLCRTFLLQDHFILLKFGNTWYVSVGILFIKLKIYVQRASFHVKAGFMYSVVMRVLRPQCCKHLFYLVTGHASKPKFISDLLYKMVLIYRSSSRHTRFSEIDGSFCFTKIATTIAQLSRHRE